jgi:serine-type D-Ala-D-Ala carboxypeptidase (penicillin-binding protein 5/6)
MVIAGLVGVAASPSAVASVGPALGLATPTPPTTAPAYTPCPRAKVKVVPTRSPMPKLEPRPFTVGGEGLNTTGLAVPEGTSNLPGIVSATSWVVADLDSGAVLAACAPHALGAPASVQKLLLAAMAMPKLDPKQVITVNQEDMNFEPGSSAVGLLLGGKYTVETLWLGLFLNSGNDAANVLARLGGGTNSQAGGVAAMNAEAQYLGAYDTHAATPSGLDGPGQATSAYDLALIARADFNREDFRRYISARTAQIPKQPPRDKKGFQIQNDNKLLLTYPGALGGKTGFTDIARHTFVGAAERDGRRLVVTMLDAEQQPKPTWQQAAALLDWGFSVDPDSAVGVLVEPGNAGQSGPTASATVAAPAPAPRPAAAGAGLDSGAGKLIAGALGATFVLVWLVILIVSRRRRPRTEADEPEVHEPVG